jgi:hypothetical protein
MNTQFQNLENKINDLVVRMNNAEETLKENATSEINSMRDELQKLINEFDLLKIKMQDENSEEKITQEVIDDLMRLIDDFITDCGTEDFRGESFSDINDCDLSINYNCEVEIESVTIDVEDYFCTHFSFDYDRLLSWLESVNTNDEKRELIKYMPRELFELITEIVDTSVRNIDTDISFRNISDFECEMDSYKKIDVTEVVLDSSDLRNVFTDEFDYSTDDIENVIKEFHNFQDEENSEENNSEE